MIDKSGNVVRVNQEFSMMSGYVQEEILGAGMPREWDQNSRISLGLDSVFDWRVK